jgi:O-antigen ligase
VSEKPLGVEWGGLLKIRKRSPVFIIVALVLGVLISIAVGQFGWLTLITIPGLLMVFSTVSNPILGLMALIIVIFAQVQRVFTQIQGLPGPGQPLVGFLILVIVIRMLLFNERSASWIRNSFILGVYLFFLMVSVVVAAYEMEPALTELLDVAQNIVIASLVIYIVKDASLLKSAIWAVIAAGILMAFFSVYQNLTGTFDNIYWGFGGTEFSGYVGRPRATGPYLTPNPYAQVLVIIFILALDRTWHESKIVLRLVAGMAALLCALAVIFTDSRGGFANLIFTLVVFFLFNRPNFSSMMVIGIFSLVIVQFLPGNFSERLLTLTELNPFQDEAPIEDESFRGRTSENIAAWMMFTDHPIIGVGLNNYAENYQTYSREIGLDPRREKRDPASLYLQLLAEQGFIGASVFLLLIISIFIKLLKAQRDFKLLGMSQEAYMTSALFASLAGYMFMSLYKNNAYHNVFWVLVALCISAAQIATNLVEHDRDIESGASMELIA